MPSDTTETTITPIPSSITIKNQGIKEGTDNTYNILISVFDQNSNPISEIKLQLDVSPDTLTLEPSEGTTDADGQLQVEAIVQSDADYTLTVTIDRFETNAIYESRFQIVQSGPTDSGTQPNVNPPNQQINPPTIKITPPVTTNPANVNPPNQQINPPTIKITPPVTTNLVNKAVVFEIIEIIGDPKVALRQLMTEPVEALHEHSHGNLAIHSHLLTDYVRHNDVSHNSIGHTNRAAHSKARHGLNFDDGVVASDYSGEHHHGDNKPVLEWSSTFSGEQTVITASDANPKWMITSGVILAESQIDRFVKKNANGIYVTATKSDAEKIEYYGNFVSFIKYTSNRTYDCPPYWAWAVERSDKLLQVSYLNGGEGVYFYDYDRSGNASDRDNIIIHGHTHEEQSADRVDLEHLTSVLDQIQAGTVNTPYDHSHGAFAIHNHPLSDFPHHEDIVHTGIGHTNWAVHSKARHGLNFDDEVVASDYSGQHHHGDNKPVLEWLNFSGETTVITASNANPKWFVSSGEILSESQIDRFVKKNANGIYVTATKSDAEKIEYYGNFVSFIKYTHNGEWPLPPYWTWALERSGGLLKLSYRNNGEGVYFYDYDKSGRASDADHIIIHGHTHE